jgi:hypothetical protein
MVAEHLINGNHRAAVGGALECPFDAHFNDVR